MKYFFGFISLILPIKKNTALFQSFRGLYSDNPKQVSIELHNRIPSLKIYWTVSRNSKETLPNYVIPVRYNSFKYYSLITRAQIVVDNYNGIRKKDYLENDYIIRRLLFRFWCRKRRRQYNVSTWHGTPFKHIANDTLNADASAKFFSSAEYVVSGCEHTTKCLNSAFNGCVQIKCYGTPRNDPLLSRDVDTISIKRKLRIPLDSRVILFAPTFRDNSDMSGKNQLEKINFDLLCNELHKKFGGEWVFVCRLHNNVLEQIDRTIFDDKRIIDGNIGDDMVEYLLISDILLTDYSSSLFDFMLLKRPCFLYVPDLYEYINEERGVYFDIGTLPFPYAEDFDGLLKTIRVFNDDVYLKKIDCFRKQIGDFEDGFASKRIVNDICYFLVAGKKETESSALKQHIGKKSR